MKIMERSKRGCANEVAALVANGATSGAATSLITTEKGFAKAGAGFVQLQVRTPSILYKDLYVRLRMNILEF